MICILCYHFYYGKSIKDEKRTARICPENWKEIHADSGCCDLFKLNSFVPCYYKGKNIQRDVCACLHRQRIRKCKCKYGTMIRKIKTVNKNSLIRRKK